MSKVGAGLYAVAKITNAVARFRVEAEERTLDELLDRIADAGGVADQDKGNPVGVREDRGPMMPGIDLLFDIAGTGLKLLMFGFLIGVLAAWVVIALLALLSS
jgi:hypothetical protein